LEEWHPTLLWPQSPISATADLLLPEIMKYATRILVCIIAVSKLQEFVRKFVDFLYFSKMTPLSSSQRVVIFPTTTQGIRLRRQVNVFLTTSYSSLSVTLRLVANNYG